MNENDNIQLEESDNVELSNTSLVIETPLENKEDNGKEIINQDFNQMMNVGLTLCLEIYRVLMGALLVFVVPQNILKNVCMRMVCVVCDFTSMSKMDQNCLTNESV